ncbi:MAG: helical backbone metal receptor [Planctomycetota bacterium]
MAKTIALIAAVGLIALMVWWSGPSAPQRPARQGVPQRVVSLAPSLTEIVIAVGGGQRLVGSTSFCQGVADDLPRVGGLKIDVEQVLALEPDLVLAIATATQEPSLQALRTAGVAVEVQSAETITDVRDCVLRVGELLDASAKAQEIASTFEALLAAPDAAEDAPRVLFVVDREPLYVAGQGSFVTAMLHAAGARNVFADRTESYLAVTIEDVFARDPDLVIDASFPNPDVSWEACQQYWKRWHKLPAIADERLHLFPQVTPGLQVTEWARRLQQIVASTGVASPSVDSPPGG